MLTGCIGTKRLKPGETVLVGQNIEAPAHIDKVALRNLYAQRPNRKFLGIPIYPFAALYYWGEGDYDQEKYIRRKEQVEKKYDAKIAKATSQRRINNYQFRKQRKVDRLNTFIDEGNLRMQWGEPLAVFDTAVLTITRNRMRNYLFAEGYFQNRVKTEVDNTGNKVEVTFHVDARAPYRIDTLLYRISDSTIFDLIRQTEAQSFIHKGQRYREEDLSRERERIDLLLKDNGYYDFSRQYINFPVDTGMLGGRKVAVMLEILDPARRGFHKQFRIDSVRFTTDAGTAQPGESRQRRTYRGVQYRFYDDLYNLKILSQRIFLAPGDLYSRSRTFESQRQLANLDAFKFVNINYDTSGSKFIANIFTSPLDRYEWSNEVGVTVTGSFPGPFYNINFKKRNIFRGLENFELNGRIGIEGVAAMTQEQNIYKSTEAGINASLIFPQFLWPFRESTQLKMGKYNPKTRVTVGYAYTDRPEYRRMSTTLANNYTWQNKNITQYSLSLTNISLINSDIDSAFMKVLEQEYSLGNYNLGRSFEPSFVSSMSFGITWSRDYGSNEKNSVFIRAQVESGGTTLNFINPEVITRRGLQYFKYLRFNFDFRRVHILNRNASLAFRLNTGMAYSYDSNNSLPYEKFYFVGGSNSVRAWRPRRLGVGTLPPPLSAEPHEDGYFNYQFEKPGEILLEGSVELRTNLVGFIDGALFVDAGNVWLFRQQTQQDPESGEIVPVDGNTKFQLGTFWKELGIGTGFGLRFDFTFLILRFDVGIKVYDPARPEDQRFVLDDVRFMRPYAKKDVNGNYYDFREPVIYNIGVGFPF